MSEKPRQIIPIGGGGFYRDPENLKLEKYIIGQSGVANPRVAFIPTASGEPDHYVATFYAAFLKLGCRPSVLTFFKRTPDLRVFLLNQDVIYVGGGNTKSLLAVWRDWGVEEVLQEAWHSGIVLTGVSAGAICWFEQGLADSFSDGLRPLACLGILPGSCCPHYDGEAERRPALHRLLLSGEISAGIAIEDWTGVHFRGTEIYKVVTAKRGARAYSMRAVYGSLQEVPLPA
jgi:dipeptidase E